MADERQHREPRLHQQTVLPLATLTQCEIGRIVLRGEVLSATFAVAHVHPTINPH